MALPHPKPRKKHNGNDKKPNAGGVLGDLFKRAINVAEYRNTEDDVNPAKNRTCGCLLHDSPRFRIFARPGAASWALRCRTVWRTQHSSAATRRTSSRRRRQCALWEFRSASEREHPN